MWERQQGRRRRTEEGESAEKSSLLLAPELETDKKFEREENEKKGRKARYTHARKRTHTRADACTH
jgi:hypothetical protein